MKIFWSLLVIAFSLSTTLFSQVKITGSVVESGTQTPLSGINVYLSETTIGTVTDDDGKFSFQTKQTGPFKLVVSSIGYKTESRNVVLKTGSTINHNFELKQVNIELDEIVVTGSNTEWNRKFNLFKDFFIGEAEFSDNTSILNPEVLRFEGPNKFGEIKVIAEKPITIRNKDLGYLIEADFIDVIFNPTNNTGVYKLNTRFTEMQTSDRKTQRKWRKNRESAYSGSQIHFFKSLKDDRLRRERFDVVSHSHFERLEDSEERKIAQFYPRIWRTLSERYTVFTLSYTPVVVGHKVRYDQFDEVINDYVLSYISYSRENPYILVDDNGALFDPSVIQLSGKWGDERVSFLLPLDYTTD